ncbi:nuclear fusion protein [Microdochium nivale]|nr:nuclear fusion protein [Microdochium nivale]
MSGCALPPRTFLSPQASTVLVAGETLQLTHLINRPPSALGLSYMATLTNKLEGGLIGWYQDHVVLDFITWDASAPVGLPSNSPIASSKPTWTQVNKDCSNLTAIHQSWTIPLELASKGFYMNAKWSFKNTITEWDNSLDSDMFVILSPLSTSNNTISLPGSAGQGQQGNSTGSGAAGATQECPTSDSLLGLKIGLPIALVAMLAAGLMWWLLRRRRGERLGGGETTAVGVTLPAGAAASTTYSDKSEASTMYVPGRAAPSELGAWQGAAAPWGGNRQYSQHQYGTTGGGGMQQGQFTSQELSTEARLVEADHGIPSR